MRLLVTGARGFIGQHLVNALLEAGHRVVGYDLELVPPERAGLSHVSGDIRELGRVHSAMTGVDGLIHLAAVSRSGISEMNPYETICTNILGTTNVLEAASKNEPHPWVIVASSRVVCDYEAGLAANQEGIYTLSKDVADRLLRYYARRYGIMGLSLRFSDVYGAVEPTMGRILTEFLLKALKGEALSVHKANMPFDFIHIHDIVRGIVLAADYLEKKRSSIGPSPSVGSFEALSFASGRHINAEILANIIVGVTSSRSNIETLDRSETFPPLIDYTEQAFEKLGFRANISLEEGLREMVNFSIMKEALSMSLRSLC